MRPVLTSSSSRDIRVTTFDKDAPILDLADSSFLDTPEIPPIKAKTLVLGMLQASQKHYS